MFKAEELQRGAHIDWLHGDQQRVAKILEIEEDRVLLEGMTSNYWMRTELLVNKINKLDKVISRGGMAMGTYC